MASWLDTVRPRSAQKSCVAAQRVIFTFSWISYTHVPSPRYNAKIQTKTLLDSAPLRSSLVPLLPYEEPLTVTHAGPNKDMVPRIVGMNITSMSRALLSKRQKVQHAVLRLYSGRPASLRALCSHHGELTGTVAAGRRTRSRSRVLHVRQPAGHIMGVGSTGDAME